MLDYRADIDGLRAFAVGSVVLYHLNESLLSGGFVGVDIFFVISGYLITKLIFNELSVSGSFRFSTFYVRRVRRLFPALFATLLLSLGLGCLLLSPTHLVDLSKSLVAAIFSISNLFFWSSAGYFDSESLLKPLLHTWSLSVEEQFYLIWPAVLVGLFALKRPLVIPGFIVVAALFSWLLNELFFDQQARITSWFPREDNQSVFDVSSTVFYWLPFRVFEFAIGAILVWVPSISASALKGVARECFFALGLAMAMYAVVGFDDAMEFPSSAALLPCIGAALMVYAGPNHRLVAVLSNRILVGIGLISYSLYLVHWPLIVFYRYWSGREFSIIEGVALVVVSVVLAYLSYRFIEQPFRKFKKPNDATRSSNKPFLLSCLAAVFAISVVSISAVTSKGWLWRYPKDMIAQLSYKPGDYSDYFWAKIKQHEKGYQNNGLPKVLVVGDSMAAGFMNVLGAAGSDETMDLASILVGNNCKSLFGLSDQQYQKLYSGASETCKNEHENVLAKKELLEQADSIVLATYWWQPHLLEFLPSSVNHLSQFSNAKIKVLGLKVQINNGIWFLNKHMFTPKIDELRTPLHPQAAGLNHKLKQTAQGYDYFDLLSTFCDQRGCQRVTSDGYVIIFDDSHLSEKGAEFVAQKVKTQQWYLDLINNNADKQ